jgi:hypothetical protein
VECKFWGHHTVPHFQVAARIAAAGVLPIGRAPVRVLAANHASIALCLYLIKPGLISIAGGASPRASIRDNVLSPNRPCAANSRRVRSGSVSFIWSSIVAIPLWPHTPMQGAMLARLVLIPILKLCLSRSLAEQPSAYRCADCTAHPPMTTRNLIRTVKGHRGGARLRHDRAVQNRAR